MPFYRGIRLSVFNKMVLNIFEFDLRKYRYSEASIHKFSRTVKFYILYLQENNLVLNNVDKEVIDKYFSSHKISALKTSKLKTYLLDSMFTEIAIFHQALAKKNVTSFTPEKFPDFFNTEKVKLDERFDLNYKKYYLIG